MTRAVRVDESDAFGRRDLDELLLFQPAPCVSLYLPTHRAGAESEQGAVRLRNLLTAARRELTSEGWLTAQVDELLTPADQLAEDRDYWRHQADGLAVFIAPEVFRTFRAPISFGELAVVATQFHVRPLLALLARDETFGILALSQNTVRLFRGSRHTVTEVDTGRTPVSLADALAHEDPEKQLQVRSSGHNGTGLFHGHGSTGEDQKAALERYFRAVDRGLAQLGLWRSTPLILAGVSYYGPIYRGISDHPELLEEMIVGNPDDLSAAELHGKAWPLIAARLTDRAAVVLDRYHQRRGVGATADGLDEVTAAATEGRIEVVFLPTRRHRWAVHNRAPLSEVHDERQPGDVDLLDEVAQCVLRTGGDVLVTDEELLPEGVDVAAIIRY